jgi:hypothetical protein
MSVARLKRNLGRREDARDLLASINGWFTEGFDTLDLKEAKVLLNELAVCAKDFATSTNRDAAPPKRMRPHGSLFACCNELRPRKNALGKARRQLPTQRAGRL